MTDDGAPLDAYSRAVISVVDTVLPSVASLAVRSARGDGAGSASVIDGGYLLTSAHVVAGSDAATAAFSDGIEVQADLVGRDPLSDLAVLKPRGAVPAALPFGDAEDAIDRPIEITVWRNGALVDVVVVPQELSFR